MNLLKTHINRIVLQDFLLKYNTKNQNTVPKFTKLSLSAKFGTQHKASIIGLLQVLTFYKPYLTQSKANILSLNLRKGDPVGVKIVLRKRSIYDFLMFLIFEILPSIKNFEGFTFNLNSIHGQIKDIFVLDETMNMYIYLMDLKTLDIVIEGKNLDLNFFIACRFPIRNINLEIK